MSGRARRRTPKRFAMLPLQVLESEAVRTLTHAAFRVLMLFAAQFNGHNNGALGVTATQAQEAGIGRNTFYRSLRALEQRGLLELTARASRVPPRPSMYSLAWLGVDDTEYSRKRAVPTHAYKTWELAA